MWWKVGIGFFLFLALISGGALAQIFIGVPVGVLLIIGAGIIHEKMFKTDPMKSSSFIETLIYGVMVLCAVLLAFWLNMTIFPD